MDKDRSLASEIRLWIARNPGRHFTLNTLDTEIGIYESADKNNRWHIIDRLGKEGLVEPYGSAYRVVSVDLTPLNWRGADKSTIKDIKWPFGIENYVRILPKNVAVVAGSKDAGKTAFLLNFIMLNMAKYPIHYYSSEMGELELKERLEAFEETGLIPLEDWNFNSFEKAFDFQDVIAKHPDDIHLIDFLEIHKDFWEVSGIIFRMWERLKTGLIVIALQKNPGATFGLGGARSLEKARLYVTLDSGKMTIEVGKNWAQKGVNPKGKTWNFKLVDGCKFIIAEEAWY